MKNSIFLSMLLIYIFSCNSSSITEENETMNDYLKNELENLNIDYSLNSSIDNIMINDDSGLQVYFFKGDTTKYIIEADYMITDENNNIHFIGGVNAKIFSEEGCIEECNAIDLASHKAILSSSSNQIFASGNADNPAIIKYNNEGDHKLTANEIIIYNYSYKSKKTFTDDFYIENIGEEKYLMENLINKIIIEKKNFNILDECPDYSKTLKLVEAHGNPIIYSPNDTCTGPEYYLSDFENCFWDFPHKNCKGEH